MGTSAAARRHLVAAAGLQVAGLAAAVAAGLALDEARLGTALRARACDTSPLTGLVLLLVAGACLGLATTQVRCRNAVGQWRIDLATPAWLLPAPLVLLAATLPSVLGCASGVRIARWQLVGSGLVGTSGLALSAAAAFAAGAAVSCALAAPSGPRRVTREEEPSFVDLAMADAEEFEADDVASRFHGVDPNA